MQPASQKKTGIGRTIIVVVIIVILVIAAGGAYLATRSSTTSTTTTSTSTSTSSVGTTSSPVTSTSSVSSIISSASSSNTGGKITTLAIDDEVWPQVNLNQLYAPSEIPYPNWLDFTVYQPLVSVNGNEMYSNGTITAEPGLAQSWTEASNGTTWDFNLRQGVTFSNGDPFNAYQVWGQMYGFYYLTGNASGWASGYTVFNMNNADFGPATLALMNASGVVSPNSQLMSLMTNSSWPIYVGGPNTLVFNLRAPFLYFPLIWVQFQGLIFDTQYVLKNGGFGTPAQYNANFNSQPIPGTGPYTVTNVVMNSQVSFSQNPNYWAKNWTSAQLATNPYMDPGHVQNVVVSVKADDVTRYVDLTSGAAQIAPILSQDWSNIVNSSQYSFFTMPDNSANIIALALNTQRYPTNITSFRQAIAHAINYSAIYQEALLGSQGGGATPMMGPVYPAFKQLYDLGNIPPYQYNVTLAKQELTSSGVNLASMQPLQFRYIQGCGVCGSVSTIVQSDLMAVGIPVSILVTTPSQYGPPLVAGAATFPTMLNQSQTEANIAWFGTATFAPDEPTPADSLLTWVANDTAGGNWAIYSNPVVQTCVNDLTDGASQSQLTADCTAMQARVSNDVPYVWIGAVKLFLASGSIVWNNKVVKSFLPDAVFSGQSATAIFNTVQFVNGQ